MSFATISSAHEKSSSITWEKSITVTVRPPISAIARSISERTAAPVGRVTRLEYRAHTVPRSTVPRSM